MLIAEFTNQGWSIPVKLGTYQVVSSTKPTSIIATGLFLIATCLFNSVQIHAAEGIMKVTELEGISEYRLENGVRVLLFPDPSKEVVTVNMTVFVLSLIHI